MARNPRAGTAAPVHKSLPSMRFIDLFAGMGGFHYALRALGHECVFVSEIDDELRKLYARNFPETQKAIFGDIRERARDVPQHDILCAGFPCQPFSKSGSQRGRRDKARGTLFDEVLKVLNKCEPAYVILENVGNFERHDSGRTWEVVQGSLEELGYSVRGTTHVASGGHGLISPHHLGYPQHRERFFVVASRSELPADPFPKADRARVTDLSGIVVSKDDLSVFDRGETALSDLQTRCVDHWNKFVKAIPLEVELPSFPLWGDEFGARYPYRDRTPYATPVWKLRDSVPHGHPKGRLTREKLFEFLPSYARSEERHFPDWKVSFIQQNRAYFRQVSPSLPNGWLRDLRAFSPSLRKLEWNCNGEVRDLWRCVLQFRPSGLRAKRYTSVPALVAMTATQIPILGPERRFITRIEGLRLQGFPDHHQLPRSRERSFAALGNAVHTGVVSEIASRLLTGQPHHGEGNREAWLAEPKERVEVQL